MNTVREQLFINSGLGSICFFTHTLLFCILHTHYISHILCCEAFDEHSMIVSEAVVMIGIKRVLRLIDNVSKQIRPTCVNSANLTHSDFRAVKDLFELYLPKAWALPHAWALTYCCRNLAESRAFKVQWNGYVIKCRDKTKICAN